MQAFRKSGIHFQLSSELRLMKRYDAAELLHRQFLTYILGIRDSTKTVAVPVD